MVSVRFIVSSLEVARYARHLCPDAAFEAVNAALAGVSGGGTIHDAMGDETPVPPPKSTDDGHHE
jgi:hypothetical protein